MSPEPLVPLSVVIPTDATAKQVVRWIRTISGLGSGGFSRLFSTPFTVVFECLSKPEGITYWLRIPAAHVDYISGQLRTLIPGVRVTPGINAAFPHWTKAVEIGMRHADRTLDVPDPEAVAASLLAAVAGVGRREAVLVQLVISPAVKERPPEPRPRVVRQHGRRPLFDLMADTNKAATKDQQAKLDTPNFLAVIRIAANAADVGRAEHLLGLIRHALTSLGTNATGFYKRLVSSDRVRERIWAGHAPLLYPGQLATPEVAALTMWPMGEPHIAGLPPAAPRHLPPTGIPSNGEPVIMRSDFPGAERLLCVTPDDLLTHMLVAGRTGTGKTTLLCSIAEQLINENYGVVLVETKGDTDQALFYELLQRIPAHRVDDVVIVDVADGQYATGYNLLDDGNPRVAVEQLCALFDHLYRDTRGVYTREALYHGLMTLIARCSGYAFVDLVPLLSPRDRTEEAWRDELVSSVRDPEIQDFWRRFKEKPKPEQARFVQPVLDRVWQLNARPELRRIIGQSRSSFSMREALEQNKILLINLAGVGEATAILAGTLMVNSLWNAFKVAKATKPNFVFLDEFAALLDLPVKLDELLARLRGYRGGMLLATQTVSLLPPDIRLSALSNTTTKVAFMGSGDDGRLFAREFGGGLTEDDFKNLDTRQVIARLAVDGRVRGPVTGTTLAPSKPTGLAGEARWKSRTRYGRPVAAVDAEIQARRRPQHEPQPSRRPRVGPQKWE